MPDLPQLKERVLASIRDRSLTPTPRWHFLAREWFIRFCALVALVVGSLSATLTFYIINTSWPLRTELVRSPLWSIVSVIPIVWFVLLAVAIGYAVHAVHRSRRGYRFNSSWLVTDALAVSLFAGAFLYAAGVGRAIDDYLIERAPGYPELSGHHPSRFFAPALGIRTGVIEMRGDALFLVGPDGETRLDTSALGDTLPRAALERPVRVVGTTTPEGVFKVEGVRPLRGRGGRMHRGFSEGERMMPAPAY